MRIRGLLVIITILILFTAACNTSKNAGSTKVKVKKELSEKSQQQYYYVFIEANRKKLLGDINGALSLYYQCLEFYPESDAAMYEIALLNEVLKNYETAIKYSEKSVYTDPSNKWYKINLAKLYLNTNQFLKAIGVYEDLYEQDPDNLEIPYNLANLYTKMGNYKKSIELFNKMEEKTGVNENLSLAKQQLYLQTGNKTKAYEEINKLIKVFPNEPRYYGIIAEMYTSDNLFLKADENYSKLFELDSTNTLGQLSIIDFYRRKMDYDNAFKMIKKVIYNDEIEFNNKVLIFVSILNNQSEFTIYNDQIRDLLIQFKELNPDKKDDNTLYADYLIKMNLLEEAKDEIEYILENYSGNVVIWEQLLSIYSFKSDFSNLYKKSNIAIDSFPEHPLFYLFNGISAMRSGNNGEAITKLKQGLKLAENSPELEVDFYTYLGEAYYENKEYPQSDYYFELVLKKEPDNIYVINNYSYYLSLREEKLEYAESISRKTIVSEPNNSTYLDTYAWILFKLGRYQDALIYIKRAYDNSGSLNDVIVEHYGDIQYKLGNMDAAIELWKQAQELGNISDELKEKIMTKFLK